MKNQATRELKRKEYIFNFESGGWNTVYAKTLKGAIKEAIKKYEYSDVLNPDPSTFRLATQKDLDSLMRLFY